MILCIDVGNSQIYVGVFEEDRLSLGFRLNTRNDTSDEIGIFLKMALRENGFSPESIHEIAICSVVPQLDYSLRAACIKYFNREPFILQAGVKTGLNIKYRNPLEVGADRIANAIAAVHRYPHRNIIVIDFGTAITFCAITAKKSYLGGAIMPGMRLSVDALSLNTAKLPKVEILKTAQMLGRTTIESIQSGVFYGVIGACKELINGLKKEAFEDKDVVVLATGGFAYLFEQDGIYDVLCPDLVLDGVRIAARMQ